MLTIKRQLTTLGLILLLLTSAIYTVFGQDVIPIPEPRPISPSVYLKTHRVEVEIDQQVATTRIEQVFYNDSDMMAEGTYIFPLPRGASVTDLVMYVDGKPIQARILDADEARETYEEIVRTLRDPALLQYIGQDAIQASVFPIQPRQEVKLEIEYSHILTVDNGLVRYVYPIRTDQLSLHPVADLAISVHAVSNDKIGSVYSPTHPVAVSRSGDFEFRAGYEAGNTKETGDFNLYYSLASETIDINLLTYRESATEDGFFLLLVAPPVSADDVSIQPRDVIVVLDQSGSMFGDKWEQAQDAAQYILDNLNPEDRFNVVSFSTGVRLYANDLQSPSETEGAKQWIEGLEAIGGTEIDAALKNAFQMSDGNRNTVILFLTDGLPTEGETDPSKILEMAHDQAPANVRIFTFGVGDDVDTFLLDSLSADFGGTGAYVRPNERIDEEVAALYEKVAAPVMTNISLDFGDMRVEDMYPDELPDLFIGSQLIITGRYRGDGEANLTLEGKINGETQTVVYNDLRFPANAGGEPTIPRLWATRKIGALLNSIRLNGESPELVDSIIRLSTRYGIITPYTSFFIDETDIFTSEGREEAARQTESNLDDFSQNRTGGGAVGAADAANELEAAEMAQAPQNMPAPTSGFMGGEVAPSGIDQDGAAGGRIASAQNLQVVNDRTFLLRDETWIDTAYDASNMTLTEIIFLSDDYFDLLDQYPAIGDYLPLGDHLIIVIEGQAYEIKPE